MSTWSNDKGHTSLPNKIFSTKGSRFQVPISPREQKHSVYFSAIALFTPPPYQLPLLCPLPSIWLLAATS